MSSVVEKWNTCNQITVVRLLETVTESVTVTTEKTLKSDYKFF